MIFERFKQLASPGGAVAVALCLVFPVAWDRFDPTLEGEPIVVMITKPRADDELERPNTAIRATDHKTVKIGSAYLTTARFELKSGGRFSLFSTSSNSSAEPVDLSINGRRVSATAFYQRTDSDRRDFEKRLLARNVLFTAGENRISLRSRPHRRARQPLLGRRITLELRREIPLTLGRYAVLFAVAVGLVLTREAIRRRVQFGSRLRLAVSSFAYVSAMLVVLPAVLWLGSDGYLGALGESDPTKVVALRKFDGLLRSSDYADAVRDRFAVAVFGDSTHFYGLPEDSRMLPTLQRTLPDEQRDAFYWFGTSGGAYSAFDFYLLGNRLAERPPDLVVVPVSLRSFAPAWMGNPGYRVRDLDHYLIPSELLRSRSLSVGGRNVPVAGWLLRRIDAFVFAGGAERLIRGAKIFAELESERITSGFESQLGWPGTQAMDPERRSGWEPHIAADHELFEAFQRLNGLAARHGFEILYYTVQPNVNAQLRNGRDIRVWENFDLIERTIGGGPGVHFLALRDPIPERMYRDAIDHLHPNGIERVAAQIAQKVVAIRDARSLRSRPGENAGSGS